MKNIFAFIFFALIVNVSTAQGNLQFNQVLSYTGSLSCNTNYCGAQSPTTYTVPAGKVWKIESAGFNGGIGMSNYFPQAYLIINGVGAYGGLMSANQSTVTGKLITSPVWLKAGDVLGWGMNSNSATGGTFSISMHISILEFNIVP
jgi:hypothetical protein